MTNTNSRAKQRLRYQNTPINIYYEYNQLSSIYLVIVINDYIDAGNLGNLVKQSVNWLVTCGQHVANVQVRETLILQVLTSTQCIAM